MAKFYKITCGEIFQEWSKNYWVDFANKVCMIRDCKVDGCVFHAGKQVMDLDGALEYVDSLWESFHEAREKTHKQISVKIGGVTNLPSNYRKVWVKK